LRRVDRASLRAAEIGVTIEPNNATADKPGGPFVYRGKFE
jgi:hypothetical protein